MYKTLVERKVRASWRGMNHGDYEPILARLAPSFEYTFFGKHTLAGARRTVPAMREWFARVFRLFPGARWEIQDVLVKGMPWNTVVAVVLDLQATLADGSPYKNMIIQTLRLRWGRVVEIRTLEDTRALDDGCRRLVAAGVAEAGAPPITDEFKVPREPRTRLEL